MSFLSFDQCGKITTSRRKRYLLEILTLSHESFLKQVTKHLQ
jgi:hypothetical protein